MFIVRTEARDDLYGIFEYIAANNFDAAMRFYDAANNAFDDLADQPGMGSLYEPTPPRLAGLRRLPAHGFRNYLIFYLTHEDHIEIVRVLHGARDVFAELRDGE